MRKFLTLMTITLAIACGSKHKVNGKVEIDPKPIKIETQKVEISVNFRDASELCDERYGVGTEESDLCFMEIVNFADSQITIVDYCQNEYETEEDIEECYNDISKVCKGKSCDKK